MKVRAIINYKDKQLKRDIKKGEEFNVKSEKRLKQLLGDNDGKYVCVEVIEE